MSGLPVILQSAQAIVNSVNITGRLVTAPEHCFRGFTHVTEFDIEVPIHKRRDDRFHILTYNELARSAKHLTLGTSVAITGFLRSEAYDMPDRSIWHKTEIVAFTFDRLG